MYYFNYTVWFAYDVKYYLQLHREGFICATYDKKTGKQLLTDLPKLIDNNSPVDLYAYAIALYQNGDRIDKDRAFAYFDKLIDMDYLPAINAYAVCLYDGICASKNLPGAARMFKKAADLDCVTAKYNLGNAYLNGYGVDVNISLGSSLIEEAASRGNTSALHALGTFYYKGKYGYPQDYYSAFNYFKEASLHYHAKAAYILADMYINGLGCTKDIEKGLKEYAHAAVLDHVPSQKFLGEAYYYGEITTKDIDRAYSFSLMAAENGDDHAMYSVGFMIVTGEVFWIDKSIGIDWLKKASKLGNENATKLLRKL